MLIDERTGVTLYPVPKVAEQIVMRFKAEILDNFEMR